MGVFDNHKFKKLHATWEKKLKRDGLPDIEDKDHRITDHKTTFDFSARIGFKSEFYRSIQEYYTWVTHSLVYAAFQSRTDEMIWIMHSEGKSSREIASQTGLAQNTVCLRIKKIRSYVKDQEPDCSI